MQHFLCSPSFWFQSIFCGRNVFIGSIAILSLTHIRCRWLHEYIFRAAKKATRLCYQCHQKCKHFCAILLNFQNTFFSQYRCAIARTTMHQLIEIQLNGNKLSMWHSSSNNFTSINTNNKQPHRWNRRRKKKLDEKQQKRERLHRLRFNWKMYRSEYDSTSFIIFFPSYLQYHAINEMLSIFCAWKKSWKYARKQNRLDYFVQLSYFLNELCTEILTSNMYFPENAIKWMIKIAEKSNK